MTDTISAAPLGLASASQIACFSWSGTGNPANLVVGFNPKWVKIYDETGVVTWEKVQGSTPANCWKTVTGGTMTVDNSSNVLFPADVGLNEPGSAVYITATVNVSGHAMSAVVEG